MVTAATNNPSTNGGHDHVATSGGVNSNIDHQGTTTTTAAAAAPTAPSSDRAGGDRPVPNDDANAIRSFAILKRRYAVQTDRHQHALCHDDDDTAMGIAYQVQEELRRIRKCRNVTVAWSEPLGSHYICDTARQRLSFQSVSGRLKPTSRRATLKQITTAGHTMMTMDVM